ncbi:putative reverse transcriptase zinc-binding domain-containing protein [Helianthus annuus]|nr:putative reverse transcriptase zinc-binding domain-containing protein [Helianthus annuus]
MGVEDDDIKDMAKVVGCNTDNIPLSYLGIKVGANMNRISNWTSIVEVFDKRLSVWKAKSISMGGRLTLINAVLESLPIYYLSLYKIPVGVIKMLEAKMRKFLWAGSNDVIKMNWVAWDWVTWPKSKGGLGISRIKEVNEALLVKWGWRYRVENQNLWRKVVDACHGNVNQRSFLPCNGKLGGCWKNIVKSFNFIKIKGKGVKHFIMGKVGNGEDIRFWIDTWEGDRPFMERWPHLFGLDLFKSCRVADRLERNMGIGGFNWYWSRLPESDVEIKEWQECRETLNKVILTNSKDRWVWNEDSQDGFSVKRVKTALINERGNSQLPNFEWCKWVPIKCNIVAWRGNLDRLATRVNLRRRNVDIISVLCPFCNEFEETVEHLFTACSMTTRVWAGISVWCKIPPIFIFDFKDILDIHNYSQVGKKAKKIIQGLVIICCWVIWKGRNELVFKNISRRPQEFVREIKSRGFDWFKNRTSCNSISWGEWCKYPMYML